MNPNDPTSPNAPHYSGPTAPGAPSAGQIPLPRTIGRYRIVGVLGQGGMGTVYEAEQEHPRRPVALKVIRAGVLTPELLRRFEHESQVLARLQHPGIAQVYEAGMVADAHGVPMPFFAMELVRGEALTSFVARKHLGTRERLELLSRVCDAVFHAHQKGVIHRDLKPGNILVDESGQPKVLDFGVARATDSDLQTSTLRTDIGQLVGTVPYMSPEQISGDPAELDTRSDVYALGVIAYELLSGRPPYDLRQRMIHEAARIIREEEPTRLSSINRTLRGDVETIIATALAKDKTRRYASAEAFASDIRRYLHDEPISARPASTWYQLSKFSRRNKGLVAGVASAFVLLVAGLAGTGYGLRQAVRARDAAQKAEVAATAARDAEKERAEQLKKVSDFQSQMLGQIDTTKAGVDLMKDVRERFVAALEKAGVPEGERSARVDALQKELVRVNATDTAAAMIDRTILKPAIKTIDEQFKSDPVTDASLRQALADLYYAIGLYGEAMPLQESALATRRRVLGEEQLDSISSLGELGRLLNARGKLPEAESALKQALQLSSKVLGDRHADTVTTLSNLGHVYLDEAKYEEAGACYREVVERRRSALGDDHPQTILSRSSLAALLCFQGRYDEAEPLYRDVVERGRRTLGTDHRDTLLYVSSLGGLLRNQGKFAEAEPLYREVLETTRRVLGEQHPDTLSAIYNMASLHQDRREFAQAESLYREALEKRRRVLGDTHADTLDSIRDLGSLLEAQGRFSEAEPYLREALSKSRESLGEDHPVTILATSHLGAFVWYAGKTNEAEPLCRDAMERSRRALSREHPYTLAFTANLGYLLMELHRYDEVVELLLPVEPVARRVFTGDNGPRHASLLTALGRARIKVGADAARFSSAESNLLEAHGIFQRALGEKHVDTLGCMRGLVDLYTAWNQSDPGKGYDAKAAEWRAKLPQPEPSKAP